MIKREYWATRIGLILAMAGNAIGLGNFLRFPVQCTKNGGGAFMIPYFVALLCLGIPLMWLEWAMGRFGGVKGHGSMPGIFSVLYPSKYMKYLGVLGIVIPLGITTYYIYIESWTLSYTFLSGIGAFHGLSDLTSFRSFLKDFQGVGSGFFSFGMNAYIFFLVTWILNFIVLYRGISKGIELLAKVAMPLLFIFAVVIAIRVLTLGTPDPDHPENNPISGLAFIWNPDLSKLGDANVWLSAAGQIFFTLSVASGAIQTYASYLKEKDDIALSGLATCATNEFAETTLGGSIAIPAAFAFFGCSTAISIAQSGAFDLGFASMPAIFTRMPLGELFGSLWFMLLFFAGITSSIALTQPCIAFFQDEVGWSRQKAVTFTMVLLFFAAHIPILGLSHGALDEMDFWAGTLGLALFALIEVIIYVFLHSKARGMGIGDAPWQDINNNADIRIPKVFKWIITYITPLYLLVILIAWCYQDGPQYLLMQDAKGIIDVFWRFAGRGVLLLYLVLFLCLIWYAWRKREDSI